jgi:hypothetical protein
MRKSTWSNYVLAVFLMVFVSMPSLGLIAAEGGDPVTLATFVRAETDAAIKLIYDQVGFGVLHHNKVLTPLDQQLVIRMNRDTLYSAAVLDLSKPAAVTLPEADGRYMSLHVINQDHFSYAVSEPGRYELTEDAVGSRYVYLIIRTFIDADDPKDIEAANAMQDAIVIEGGGDGPLDIPDWNGEQLLTARQALNTLAKLGMNAALAFGTREETYPIDHLVGAAAGWGGLPQKNAFYEISSVTRNDGTPHSVTVTDVPIDAFWSVTVYNADGYIEENPLGVYSFNNVTAKPNDDGSITIHFGGCDDGRVNCLPVSEGWNYAVRMYEPRPEILDGSWTFPDIKSIR